MRKIIIISIAFLVNACGSAWVVRRSSDGGVIGYKGYSTEAEATAAIQKLAHCPFYEIVDDSLRQSSGSFMMAQQSTSYNNGTVYNNHGQSANYRGTQTQTQYVPVQVNNYWREATYSCRGSN